MKGATWNAVRIAAGKHSGASGSIRMTRAVNRGTARWPGEEDAERLGFFVGGDRSFPDLDRLFAECVWNAERQRWEPDLRPIGWRRGH